MYCNETKRKIIFLFIYIMVHILFTLYTTIFCHLTEAYQNDYVIILSNKSSYHVSNRKSSSLINHLLNRKSSSLINHLLNKRSLNYHIIKRSLNYHIIKRSLNYHIIKRSLNYHIIFIFISSSNNKAIIHH